MEDVYTTNVRFYSEEGLLIWKARDYCPSLKVAISQIRTDLSQGPMDWRVCEYEDEPNSHAAVHGDARVRVLCPILRRCNIQVRKNGKLISWKHLLNKE